MQKKEVNKMSQDRGITLVVLIITVIILLILAGVTVTFIINDNVTEEAEDYADEMNKQIREQESLSNMVRNLYDN